MTLPDETESLVRQTARGFSRRYAEVLSPGHTAPPTELPAAVLDEIAALGWLDDLSHGDDSTAAMVLAALVFELGLGSPALGARLLCHHFGRAWVHAACSESSETAAVAGTWLAVAAFEPMPTCGADRMAMVVGLPESRTLLWTRADADKQATLSLVPAAAVLESSRVRMFGLDALDVRDVRIRCPDAPVSPVATGTIVETARLVALRKVAPAYAAVLRAVVTRCRLTARRHAQCRRQGGCQLERLPEVAALLERIDEAFALTSVIEKSLLVENDPLPLIGRARRSTLDATDAGVQVLGGAGYVVGSGQESLFRDARQLSCLLVPPWQNQMGEP